MMESVQNIESAVEELSPDELSEFRGWFEAYDAKHWDQQFEQDVKAGKLKGLAEQARSDYKAGQCKKL